jgi:hypothetical protein
LSGGELLARLLWEIATTGRAKFPDGTELEVGPKDWLETVKWLYAHIDGPAPKPEPVDPDEGLTDEDLEKMSDDELEALIRRKQKREAKGRRRGE